jgi:thiol-disulfide isomerase/thioredoxin
MTTAFRTLATAVLLGAALPAAAVTPGTAAPGLAMPRLADSTSTVSLGRYRGKVVYVDFWASWCIPCRVSLPFLDRLHKEHAAKGFEIVGVNKDNKAEDAEGFLKKVPVGFTLVSDESDQAAKAFAVKTMPSGYLIDRKGIVRHVHGGFTRTTQEALREEVVKLLAESP